MPEEEPFSGNRWNRRVNVFLSALGWRQIGDSNVDIACGQCGRKHGLDSVFVYEVPGQPPQMVLVEAKLRKWRDAGPAKIQQWCESLLQKIDHVPYAPDFLRKFPLPKGVSCDTGLIILWINDEDQFDPHQWVQRLRTVKVPEYRKNPKRVFVLANHQILSLCAIATQLRGLGNSDDSLRELSFYLPSYGRFNSTVTDILPLEYIYSKLIFARAEKTYHIKHSTTQHTVDIVFYTGAVDSDSLDLLFKAVRRLQLGANERDLYLYFAQPTDAERSALAQFRRELRNGISGELKMESLTLPATLPGWLSHED